MKTGLSASVVICTHNPNRDFLDRTLQSVRNQTLNPERWELLLIDNASDDRLSESIDLSWHPHGRVCREDALGLTPARLHGIRESGAELIIFADDDNILAADYIETALRLAGEWPILGVWGGQVAPDFVEPPPDWIKPYWFMLALRNFKKNCWANLYSSTDALPCGAGMCVRRQVADAYAQAAKTHPLRIFLDRRGASLASSGDTDLAYTACDLNLGMGQFVDLKLQHIIPPGRTTREYLLKLHEGMIFSGEILSFIRDKEISLRPHPLKNQLRHVLRMIQLAPFERKMYWAGQRGQKSARECIAAYLKDHPVSDCRR